MSEENEEIKEQTEAPAAEQEISPTEEAETPAAEREAVQAEAPAAEPVAAAAGEDIGKVKKGFAIFGMSFSLVFATAVLTVIVYLLYVICSFYRIADALALDVTKNREEAIALDGSYNIITYNVGFGAYGPDYTFFMDTGIMKDGTPTVGAHGTAVSKADVEKNINGSAKIISDYMPDFAIIQEVDYDSTRSYKVDQRAVFNAIDGYATVFAENYHSSYLMYPFNDPHGANNAGIMTLSKYRIKDSTRYAFPISTGLSKLTDLDRCFSITHVAVGADKTLSIISLHMSAYDKGGVIRKQQAALLSKVLTEEYSKGYYVIAGGDFNHDLIGNLEKFPSAQGVPEWVASYDKNDIPEHFAIVADNNSSVGSCRGADVKWERNWTYTCVIDGFIVSDNILVDAIDIMDEDFAFSDHNPVRLGFSFKH